MSARRVVCDGDVAEKLRSILAERGVKKLFLVCGRSFDRLPVRDDVNALPAEIVRFGGFTPNPCYEDVRAGVKLFRAEGCDCILAVGGGSAMDVAKCVKLFSGMDPARNYSDQAPKDTGIVLIAMPTTAGTGSESTRFAVIYDRGEKQSVTHDSILPDYAVLEPAVLTVLPDYPRKCAMLDALCQGIEAWWSVNSTLESRGYSRLAVEGIRDNWQRYIEERSPEAEAAVMMAANSAGRAINIAQTTAPHAMSYKLTSLYGLPHGHAVAVCLPEVWEYMLDHPEELTDGRGSTHVSGVFADIARSLGAVDLRSAVQKFREFLKALGISRPVSKNKSADLELLSGSVNPVRLRNNPVALDRAGALALYERIISQ